MSTGRFGISFQTTSPSLTVETIVRAEALGVPAVWLTTGGAGPDALTIFAAAAARTRSIKMGTAIVPTFPRHPLVMVQQAEVIANLAPNRLILGLGTSHQPIIEGSFGLPFDRPLQHLREYVSIVRTALHDGTVNFTGARLRAQAQIPLPSSVPVMISALRANSFRLAGKIADGAIAWICPAPYLRDVALPALRDGAVQANRTKPPLVAHAFVAVTEDAGAVTAAARKQLAIYPRLPFYAQTFVAAGHPEAQRGEWSDGMLDAVVIHGNEAKVADGLQTFLATSGASEMIVSVLTTESDAQVSIERAIRLVATL